MSSTHTSVDAGEEEECPESGYTGVSWEKQQRKWRGQYQDRLGQARFVGRKEYFVAQGKSRYEI